MNKESELIFEEALQTILKEEKEVPYYAMALSHPRTEHKELKMTKWIIFLIIVLSGGLIGLENVLLYRLFFLNKAWFFVASISFTGTFVAAIIILYLFKVEVAKWWQMVTR